MVKTTDSAKRVLVADDDPDIRSIVASAIELLGHVAVQAENGLDAINLLSEDKFDLAILDLMMPEHSGLEVCRHIKAAPGSYLPVLVLTARDAVQDKVSAFDDGADDYLTKPFAFDELRVRVKSLLDIKTLTDALEAKNVELKELQEKLIAAERQAAVGQIVGSVAHQLGQPLSAILLNCHLVERLPPSDPRFKNSLVSIKDDVQRLGKLIDHLKSADAGRTETYYGGAKIVTINNDDK